MIAAPGMAAGQTPKIYRLAVLSPGPPTSDTSPDAKLLLASLEKYGYIIDQNLVLDGPRERAAQCLHSGGVHTPPMQVHCGGTGGNGSTSVG
jgi:hypothetical protein